MLNVILISLLLWLLGRDYVEKIHGPRCAHYSEITTIASLC
jgi:hypothetical protein